MSAADELSALMDDRGRLNYGENVTIAEHSLLTAAAAEQQGHHDTLVAACLMHDVGHWLDEPDDGYGIYDHGDLGGDWVAARFDAAVSEPVRLTSRPSASCAPATPTTTTTSRRLRSTRSSGRVGR